MLERRARCDPGNLVFVYNEGVEVGRAVVGADGRWTAALHVQTGQRTRRRLHER